MSFGYSSNIEISSDNVIELFGRTRVSEPYTLFDSKMLTNSDYTNWSLVNSTSPAQTDSVSFVYNTTQPYARLSLGTGVTGKIISQSRRYLPYLPGKSTVVFMTGTLVSRTGSTASQATTRIGYFDDKVDKTNGSEIKTGDGWYFQCIDNLAGTDNNFTLSVVERSCIDVTNPTNPTQVDYLIPQSNWNNDPLNGSGPSGYIFDPREKHPFFINFQWLGSGIVSMGIILNAKFVTCHIFSHAGGGPYPYTTRPSLPIGYEISRILSVVVPVNLVRICSTVIVEGGFNPVGFPFAITSRLNGKQSGNVPIGTKYQ